MTTRERVVWLARWPMYAMLESNTRSALAACFRVGESFARRSGLPWVVTVSEVGDSGAAVRLRADVHIRQASPPGSFHSVEWNLPYRDGGKSPSRVRRAHRFVFDIPSADHTSRLMKRLDATRLACDATGEDCLIRVRWVESRVVIEARTTGGRLVIVD